jgi:hypothetical protein
MTGIFYPYLVGASRWQELRYSLRSLEKFFEEEAEVWIVGDCPDWIQNVRYIEHHKNERVYCASTYDAVMKLEAYIKHKDSPEKFIRMYDDIYFIGPRTLHDLEVTRYLFTYDQYREHVFISGSVPWRDQVNRTMEIVKGAGFRGLMTETHCPEVFLKKRMKNIFKQFDPANNLLLTSTLYYNMYPYEHELQDRKVERALYYGGENLFGFGPMRKECGREGVIGRYFLNHNDVGLDKELKKYLERMFPVKSKYEI